MTHQRKKQTFSVWLTHKDELKVREFCERGNFELINAVIRISAVPWTDPSQINIYTVLLKSWQAHVC